MRKLASVKRISKMLPIEGKDRIALAVVDGWNVIVRKSEFEEGGLCVYVEIDSVMPDKPEFAFLKDKNFRIKTMKMAGVISQGICFPLSILPQKDWNEGDDVTEVLGVKQYEDTMDDAPRENMPKKKWPKFLMRWAWFRRLVQGRKKNDTDFPSFISKTDETRIQNMPGILNDKREWVATEKIDGQSGTFCLVRKKRILPFGRPKFEYIVCSRNRRLPVRDNSSYWKVSDRYQIRENLRRMIGDFQWIAIQGECVGPGIQKNKYNFGSCDLYVFNLITPLGRMDSESAEGIMRQFDMKFVPIVDRHYVLPDTVKEVLDFAHGQSMIANDPTSREGIVFRSKDGKQSFKAVDPLFLMEHDE